MEVMNAINDGDGRAVDGPGFVVLFVGVENLKREAWAESEIYTSQRRQSRL
jgi:hypothetical protein